jgi:hypothetical protein
LAALGHEEPYQELLEGEVIIDLIIDAIGEAIGVLGGVDPGMVGVDGGGDAHIVPGITLQSIGEVAFLLELSRFL